MTKLLGELADYIKVLSRSAKTTSRAEDRTSYTNHLASAAEIFACLHSGRITEVRKIITDEQRNYGIGYLSDDEGEAATSAFAKFSSIIESSHAP